MITGSKTDSVVLGGLNDDGLDEGGAMIAFMND